ncbi:MAG: DNA alkylation repair protein [Bacteroidales bacterium]|nr:DNA alkylation repair protein [Bacteroidales bacterium]
MQDSIQAKLFALQDLQYRDFQCKLMPTISPDRVIGVRTPLLRALAKELKGTAEAERFMAKLPHQYYEENNLHAFLLEQIKDFDQCIAALQRFLPYVDNWATCDSMSPKVFKKHHAELLQQIPKWLASKQTYTIRFGIGMLMGHFLDEDFDASYLEMVANVTEEDYYVRMMAAWYFATALTKQYETTIPILEQKRLAPWVHNKTIQKACESYRISPEIKTYLKELKIIDVQ